MTERQMVGQIRMGRAALRAGAMAAALAVGGCVVVPIPIPMGMVQREPIAPAEFRAPPATQGGEIVRAVNDYRRGQGLAPLSWNDQLAAAAARHAADLAVRGDLSHRGSDGRSLSGRVAAAGYDACMVAENLASGQRDVAQVVAGWIGSPAHRANMVHPHAQEAGGAFVNQNGARVWVLNLGARCR